MELGSKSAKAAEGLRESAPAGRNQRSSAPLSPWSWMECMPLKMEEKIRHHGQNGLEHSPCTHHNNIDL